MDVERGFEIEHPASIVPWGCSEEELVELLAREPRRVTDGYLTLDCTALTGMLLTAGFHFEPRRGGSLHRIDLFRGETLDLGSSYARFQHHLELTFGEPHETTDRHQQLPTHEWRFGRVRVLHALKRRFVHEETIRLERI